MTPETVDDLIRRVEAATGPDRELDCYIWGAVEGWTVHELKSNVIVADKPGEVQRVLGWADSGNGLRNVNICRDEIPRLSTSIDAALALVERVLPGWCVLLGYNSTKAKARADVHSEPLGVDGYWPEGANAPTLPLAILAALLRATRSTEA